MRRRALTVLVLFGWAVALTYWQPEASAQTGLYLTQPFYVTIITQSVNHATTITWQSSQFFRYLVWEASALGTNTQWFPVAYVWGATNVSSTTWTDTTATAGVKQRFYRVQRLLGSSIAAGGAHSLAILTDGSLWAWGEDDQGQLGDATNLNEAAPEPVGDPSCGPPSLSNAVAVAAGGDFSIAVDPSGTVWSWGDGGTGGLGNGTGNSTNLPVAISGISSVVSVAASDYHTLALRSDGTVWAWGDNSAGQLGVGSFGGTSYSPTQSMAVSRAIAIAAGDSHSVALDGSGNVWTWGDNTWGQLGNGNTTQVPTPKKLSTISNVVAVAAGYEHTLAVTADRTVWTWGYNLYGELGRSDTNGGYDPLPAPVPGLSNQAVVAIAGGNEFSLAVTTNGQVYAWGQNNYGQLGTSDWAACDSCDICNIGAPTLVSNISNAVLVSAHPDGDHSLAVTVNQGTNQYYGWGHNASGQVGSGSGDNWSAPTQLYFCDACSNCVQLGTGGVFTAQCTGILRLYFNDGLGVFCNNSGSYTVTVNNVAANIVVMGTNAQGAVAGVVTNGMVYQYAATGYCGWDISNSGLQADPSGDGTNGVPVSCSDNPSGMMCPYARCLSLVGRIQ